MDMYCAICINKNNSYTIEKVVSTNLNLILSFDIIFAFTIIKYNRKAKAHENYNTYLDYWFKTHNENTIANRALTGIKSRTYTLTELTEIRSIITGIDSSIKDINIKRRLETLYSKLFGEID